jgi:exonuclease III
MRFALLNINSVRAKLDDLYELCKLDLFQIIFIQESKLDSSVPDEHVTFFDYKVLRRDRTSNGGGILILVKN